MRANVRKIQWLYFLSGFVLWYGIEKLYMQSIGITALGIGWAVIVLQVSNVLLDIPTGMLADVDRRKTLMLSSAAMIACCLCMGLANSIWLYLVGVIFYSLHVTTGYNTADALLYDSLLEEHAAKDYDKVSGRVFLLYMGGYAVANLFSGLLAQWLGFRPVYLLAIAPALVCAVIAYSMVEPIRHRALTKRDMWQKVKVASRALYKIPLLQVLVWVMCLMWIGEAFKEGFGQLYMLRYTDQLPLLGRLGLSEPAVVGILFALFYGVWALGSNFNYWFRDKLSLLVVLSILPFFVMAFVDGPWSILMFMVQAFMAGALFIRISVLIQDETPSDVRASVLSVRTFTGRLFTLIPIFAMGWVTDHRSVLWAVWIAALAAAAALVLWIGYCVRARNATSDVRSAANGAA